MKREVTIVRLKDWKYVKDWQYSQGIFDYETTANPFEAKNFPGNYGRSDFEKFFKKIGAKLIRAKMSFEVIR